MEEPYITERTFCDADFVDAAFRLKWSTHLRSAQKSLVRSVDNKNYKGPLSWFRLPKVASGSFTSRNEAAARGNTPHVLLILAFESCKIGVLQVQCQSPQEGSHRALQSGVGSITDISWAENEWQLY
jgi:hypothetical protein